MKLKTSIISAVGAIAASAAIAFALTGCQGAQTKIDLPSHSGKPTYLLSVDSKNNPRIFTPKGEPWQACKSRECLASINLNEKAAYKIFKESKAQGGFIVLNYTQMKEMGLININIVEQAHAQSSCFPLGVYYFPDGMMAYYPPGCNLP